MARRWRQPSTAPNDYDRAWEDLLAQRGVDPEAVCEACAGVGVRVYSNTSTWRKGVGGQAITSGICDVCWGSGDPEKPWLNLRELEAQKAIEIAQRALTAVIDSCAANSSATKGSIKEIIVVLDKLTRARKTGLWTAPLANSLANILRRAIGEPEVKWR